MSHRLSSRVVNLGTIAVASTRRLRFYLTKDGEEWLDVDSVTITFKNPDGTTFNRSAVLDSANAWVYVTTITDFLVPGDRYLKVRVQDGLIDDTFPHEIRLTVTEQPP